VYDVRLKGKRRTQIGLMIMISTYHDHHDHLRSLSKIF
jgi:hypothetical protein